MAEEFQESDVIWPDSHRRHSRSSRREENDECDDCNYGDIVDSLKRDSRFIRIKKLKKQQNMTSSLPVNIPEKVSGRPWLHYLDWDEEDDYDEGEMVPPHLIVARRIAGKMAFSVCTGNGRTLKGRDLSEVRNSILRMTGFLES